MNEALKKPVEIIVGLVLIGVSLKLFLGSGLGESLFAAHVETGRLGQTGFDILSSVAEFVFGIAGGIGSLFIFSMLNGIKYIVEAISPFLAPTPTPPPVVQQSNTVGTESTKPIPEAMYGDLARMLVQSALDGDKTLTVALAEKMAGKPYLHEPAKLSSSFPTVEGK